MEAAWLEALVLKTLALEASALEVLASETSAVEAFSREPDGELELVPEPGRQVVEIGVF